MKCSSIIICYVLLSSNISIQGYPQQTCGGVKVHEERVTMLRFEDGTAIVDGREQELNKTVSKEYNLKIRISNTKV